MVSCSTSVKAWFMATIASPGESVVADTRALKPFVATTLPRRGGLIGPPTPTHRPPTRPHNATGGCPGKEAPAVERW